MLRRALWTALLCVAVWTSGHEASVDAPAGAVGSATIGSAVGSADHVAYPAAGAGRTDAPSHPGDVWHSAGAAIAFPTWRLDGHPADSSDGSMFHPLRAPRTASPPRHRTPAAPHHVFDLPLLI